MRYEHKTSKGALETTAFMPGKNNMNENSTNTGIRIDDLCRIVIGELKSGPHTHPQAAQKEIDRLRSTPLRAEIRNGKDGQWFAAVEDSDGALVLYSGNLNSQSSARAAAQAAVRVVKG